MEFNSPLLIGLVGVLPRLLFWTAIIIVSLVILRRNGGKAEHYIFAGLGLKLVSVLMTIPAAVLVPWLVQNDYSMTTSASFASGYEIFCNVISMAGILCFIYAFKVKFIEKNECVGSV